MDFGQPGAPMERVGNGDASPLLSRASGSNNLIINPRQLVATTIGSNTYLFFAAQSQNANNAASIQDTGVWSYRVSNVAEPQLQMKAASYQHSFRLLTNLLPAATRSSLRRLQQRAPPRLRSCSL